MLGNPPPNNVVSNPQVIWMRRVIKRLIDRFPYYIVGCGSAYTVVTATKASTTVDLLLVTAFWVHIKMTAFWPWRSPVYVTEM